MVILTYRVGSGVWPEGGCSSIKMEVVEALHEICTGTWLISFRMITGGHMEIDHMWGAREGAVEVAQVEGDEGQNEGSGSPGSATCWLCNQQDYTPGACV